MRMPRVLLPRPSVGVSDLTMESASGLLGAWAKAGTEQACAQQ